MVVVRQNAAAVGAKGFGELLEYADTRCLGPCDPAQQVRLGRSFVGLRPEESQIFFHVVCRGQRLIEAQRLFEASPFVAVVPEVFGILQNQPSSAFEDLLVEQVGGLTVEISSQFGEFLVE